MFIKLKKIYEICHPDHVNFKNYVNKFLNKMGIFIWLDNNKHKFNILKWGDVKDMVTKKIQMGNNDNKKFETIHMFTLSINAFKQSSFLVSTLITQVIKHIY